MSQERVITIEVHARTNEGHLIADEVHIPIGGGEAELRCAILDAGSLVIDALKAKELL